jgi:adenylate kinase family enzyme
MPLAIGPRVVVYGPSGSGKTTLARRIAASLGVPHIELDALFHDKPNWQDASREEFRAKIVAALEQNPDGWVFDGNYSVGRDLVLPNADTAVVLRLPFVVVYPRLVWRTVSRMVTREKLWGVNHESFRMSFLSSDSILLWGITNWRRGSRRTERDLQAIPNHARVITLRSPSSVGRFVAGLPDGRDG